MSFRIRIRGKWACFTRPEMKAERVSYDIITPSAARGIIEAVYWKPSIRWVIDEIMVLNPVRFSSIRRNEVKGERGVASERSVASAVKKGRLDHLQVVVEDDRTQRSSLVLRDVDYVVTAHFEMTGKARPDDNPGKHSEIFQRRMERGQHFHQPCLGLREFPADVSLLAPADEAHQPDASLVGERDLGFMLFDFDFVRKKPLFYRAVLRDGIVKVPHPGSPEVRG